MEGEPHELSQISESETPRPPESAYVARLVVEVELEPGVTTVEEEELGNIVSRALGSIANSDIRGRVQVIPAEAFPSFGTMRVPWLGRGEEERLPKIPLSAAFQEHRKPPRDMGLTFREHEIIALAARGFENKAIAESLGVRTEWALQWEWELIWRKLKAFGLRNNDRTEAVAIVHGIGDIQSVETIMQFKLTKRQLEVVNLIAQGAGNNEIGGKLLISSATAKVHVYKLLQKTGARDRTHLIAILGGVVDPPLQT